MVARATSSADLVAFAVIDVRSTPLAVAVTPSPKRSSVSVRSTRGVSPSRPSSATVGVVPHRGPERICILLRATLRLSPGVDTSSISPVTSRPTPPLPWASEHSLLAPKYPISYYLRLHLGVSPVTFLPAACEISRPSALAPLLCMVSLSASFSWRPRPSESRVLPLPPLLAHPCPLLVCSRALLPPLSLWSP